MHLEEFNSADADRAASIVSAWADVPVWVAELVRDRPYATVDELAASADRAAQSWGDAELEHALARHPRIGDRVEGGDADATASRSEQSGMNEASDEVAAAIAAGNAEYERRFGRVFLIRAAGRSAAEMLSELRRRLRHDAAEETAEAAEQLRQIAGLRLRGAFDALDDEPQSRGTEMTSHITTHVLDAASGDPATGVRVALATADGAVLAEGVTDDDGRLALGPETLSPGGYSLAFASGDYFRELGRESFYPSVTVSFVVGERAHYHVPLLLSPFAYSTYRGS